MSSLIKRIFDILLSVFFLIVFAIPMLIIALLVRLTSTGPALYWSQRVGQNNELFTMAKFRSMRTTAPEVATHLLGDSGSWITPLGKILRKTSLDELPQLLQILQGHMSFVGPRPALHNQQDLIELRTALDVHTLKPGITGLAQTSGRDELLICEKVEFDRQYLVNHPLLIDVQLIFKTAINVLLKRGVKQAGEEDELQSVTVRQGQQICCFASPDTLSAVAVAMKEHAEAKVVCWRDPLKPDIAEITSLVDGAQDVYFIARERDAVTIEATLATTALNKINLIHLPNHEAKDAVSQIQSDAKIIQTGVATNR